MHVCIFGAGAFGRALEKILLKNRHTVSFFDPLVFPEVALEDVATRAEVIIIATPSSAIPKLLENYPQDLKKIPTILASKGLASLTLFRDFANFSILAGPAFADSILSGVATTFTASSPLARTLFENEQITIESCSDVLGILLCGSLKNIYAIGAGYQNAKNQTAPVAYVEQAYAELARYLAGHGAKKSTTDCACGIGDLRLTCTNPTSRNFRCGQLLAKNMPLDEIKQELQTIEGLTALNNIESNGYPLLEAVRALVSPIKA